MRCCFYVTPYHLIPPHTTPYHPIPPHTTPYHPIHPPHTTPSPPASVVSPSGSLQVAASPGLSEPHAFGRPRPGELDGRHEHLRQGGTRIAAFHSGRGALVRTPWWTSFRWGLLVRQPLLKGFHIKTAWPERRFLPPRLRRRSGRHPCSSWPRSPPGTRIASTWRWVPVKSPAGG